MSAVDICQPGLSPVEPPEIYSHPTQRLSRNPVLPGVTTRRSEMAYNQIRITTRPVNCGEYKMVYHGQACNDLRGQNIMISLRFRGLRRRTVSVSFIHNPVSRMTAQSPSQPQANAFAEHFANVCSDDNYIVLFQKTDFKSVHTGIFSSASDPPEVYNQPFTFAELIILC